jgi:hypothetical protein
MSCEMQLRHPEQLPHVTEGQDHVIGEPSGPGSPFDGVGGSTIPILGCDQALTFSH